MVAEKVWDQGDLAVDVVAAKIEHLVKLSRSAELNVQIYAARQMSPYMRLYCELTGCTQEEAAARFAR